MKQLIGRVLDHEKVKFVVVGGIGFIVNFLSLTFLFRILNLPIIIAQIIGVELAVIATFIGNSQWAFKGHEHIPLLRKLWRFHVSAATGMAINSLIVVLLVQLLHAYYGLALIVGSTAGLAWNYTLYRRFVFKTHVSSGPAKQ